jgi:hypothetical protein
VQRVVTALAPLFSVAVSVRWPLPRRAPVGFSWLQLVTLPRLAQRQAAAHAGSALGCQQKK